MNLFENLAEWTKFRKKVTEEIGFVPTMGALHEGHLSLLHRAKKENAYTVCSIFVNPLQFNNKSDLTNYPRDLSADQKLLESVGCNAVLFPTPELMYPQDPLISLNFGHLETTMEGTHRPGHFNGVGIVVAKLFNLVRPDRAYFGQKDWQQYLVIRQLVRDLSFNLEVVPCPIIRELDGLALSSRNVRLDEGQRRKAPQIYQILQETRNQLKSGELVNKTLQKAIQKLAAIKGFIPEYVIVADAYSLKTLERIEEGQKVLLATAVQVGEVRLIDNIVFEI